ncbi:MAG TPA: amino acid adenylation domain-containing protein, partial [Ktedonobacteraceae bacterium]
MSNSLEHVVPSSPTQSTLLSLQSKEEAYNIQLSYWKQQLNGVQPVLELPVDHPRSPVQTFQRATYRFMLSNNLSEALRTISQQQEGALFVTLLAAFQTLLFRYTGQEDLVVGLPVASRNQVEVEGVSNAFVNMLPLRCDLSGNLRFRELLHQVHKVVSEAHAHQDLPFEDLIRELKLEQDLSRNRLVQIIFTLQNTSVSSPRSIDLALRQVEIANGIAQYDVALVMTDTAQGLIGELQYNAKLFEAATIARMLGHFQTLMESIVADPEQRLAELPLLTAAERQQLLADWNATEAEYPKDQCVHQLFEAQVERTPDAVAVISEEQQLTYHDLNVQANQLAHHLRTLGVGPEVLVGLCVERSLEMIVGLLGILKAGGAYVPLDPAYPSERLAFMLQDTQVGVLLTQQRLVENLPDHKAKVICLDTGWEANAESVANPFNEVAGDNLAYVIYTSGSTGKPKGVPITQQNLIHSTYTRMIYYPTVIKCLLLSTLAFDISGAAIFWTLCQGGTLILPQQDLEQDPSQIAEVIAHRQVSHMLCISSLYSLLLTQAQHGQLRSLQVVIVGGESGPRDLPERHSALLPDTTLFNEYGLTEGAVWSSVYEIGLQGLGTTIPIGQPIANVQIYLLDRHLQPVPIGIPGELYIGGEGLARGYLHRPELTAERFIPHPFSTEPGARLYKTGDLARYRADGTIEFLGRLDQQVKLRGYRIELGEIEALLSQHPAVRECLVLVREAGVDDKRLVAYLLPEQAEQTPSLGELRSYLQAKLPEYMVPTAFVEVEAWPLTPNGKIDRRALPAPQRTAAAGASSALAPRTPLEEVLLGIWAQVLGEEQVGLHDNFFELGGHSLLAMQVVWRVREALQVELPLSCLFETPTVAQVAQRLQTLSQTTPGGQIAALEPVVRPRDLPLSFAQQRLWFLEQWEPESPLYNLPLALRLRGPLEVAILEQSLSEILRRHEALRTSFAIKEGQAVQVI